MDEQRVRYLFILRGFTWKLGAGGADVSLKFLPTNKVALYLLLESMIFLGNQLSTFHFLVFIFVQFPPILHTACLQELIDHPS